MHLEMGVNLVASFQVGAFNRNRMRLEPDCVNEPQAPGRKGVASLSLELGFGCLGLRPQYSLPYRCLSLRPELSCSIQSPWSAA